MITTSDMSRRPDEATADPAVLRLFEERMRDIWQRGEFPLDDRDDTCRSVRLLLEYGGFEPARAMLARSGMRATWNQVLAEQRSRFLADWLYPHLAGQVLDVLGGDFTVLLSLVGKGLPPDMAVGCERRTAYELDWTSLPFPVYDFGRDFELPPGRPDTYLISTVLHHEPDLGAFLASLDRGPARRWVVVENCLDQDNSEAFHLYVDEFFNKCLNSFDVPCVPQHRTVEAWRELLGGYGQVVHEETRREVPGMPFPYTLFVIDRRPGQ